MGIAQVQQWYENQHSSIRNGSLLDMRQSASGRTRKVINPDWRYAEHKTDGKGQSFWLIPINSAAEYNLGGIGFRNLLIRKGDNGRAEAFVAEMIGEGEYLKRKNNKIDPKDFTGQVTLYYTDKEGIHAAGRFENGKNLYFGFIDSTASKEAAKSKGGRVGGNVIKSCETRTYCDPTATPAQNPCNCNAAQTSYVGSTIQETNNAIPFSLNNCRTYERCDYYYYHTSYQNSGDYYNNPYGGGGSGGSSGGGTADPVPQWLIDYIKWQQEELDKRRQADGMAAWKAKLQADKFALLPPCPGLTDAWKPLVEFKAPKAVVDRINNLDDAEKKQLFGDTYNIQTLENADGAAVNLDYFPIKVDKLPVINHTQMTAPELLEYIRLNLNHVVDKTKSSFEPSPIIPNEATRWLSNPLGSIISIDIPGPDNASVVVSQYQSSDWIFTTIHDPQNADHPVSGNRQFGYTQDQDGGYTFFTRGADRITNNADELLGKILNLSTEPIQFEKADQLWDSFQDAVRDFVKSNQGQASKQAATKNRPDWSKIREAIKNNRPLSTVDCK